MFNGFNEQIFPYTLILDFARPVTSLDCAFPLRGCPLPGSMFVVIVLIEQDPHWPIYIQCIMLWVCELHCMLLCTWCEAYVCLRLQLVVSFPVMALSLQGHKKGSALLYRREWWVAWNMLKGNKCCLNKQITKVFAPYKIYTLLRHFTSLWKFKLHILPLIPSNTNSKISSSLYITLNFCWFLGVICTG